MFNTTHICPEKPLVPHVRVTRIIPKTGSIEQSSQSYTVYYMSYRIRRRLNIVVERLVQIVYHLTRSHLIITSRHLEPDDITQIEEL